MEQKVQRYYELKAKQKVLEQELGELRQDILAYLEETGEKEQAVGGYQVKLVIQQRKEYDDAKLYRALPDPQVWRLMSKADSGKIASLTKLKIISEEAIANAYTVKTVHVLQIDKL